MDGWDSHLTLSQLFANLAKIGKGRSDQSHGRGMIGSRKSGLGVGDLSGRVGTGESGTKAWWQECWACGGYIHLTYIAPDVGLLCCKLGTNLV
jgi:hypothetical protein